MNFIMFGHEEGDRCNRNGCRGGIMEEETMPVKIHKVEIMVKALNDDYSNEDIISELEATKYLDVNVIDIETKIVDWHDRHPLNLIDRWQDAYKELFGAEE